MYNDIKTTFGSLARNLGSFEAVLIMPVTLKVFILKLSACCVWQTTRHSYLQRWPVKDTKQKTAKCGLKVESSHYCILCNMESITLSSNSFPFGSMAESCLNASSPTKHIS